MRSLLMKLRSMNKDRFVYSAKNCPIKKTLEIIGEKWTLLILREVFYGNSRFEDLLRGTGCARNLLSARLTTLVQNEILIRTPYREDGSRERFEYHLAEKGKALFTVLVSLMQWGNDWTANKDKPFIKVRHRGCKADVSVSLICAHGHHLRGSQDVYVQPEAAVRPASQNLESLADSQEDGALS